MAFKARPAIAGTSDTTIYECPVGTEGAAVLGISNLSGSAATFTLKFVSAALGTTTTIAAGQSLAAHTGIKFPQPLALEAGDALLASGSVADAIAVMATVTIGTPGPNLKGLTPRGAYSGVATYQTGDFVSLNGSSYASRTDDNLGNDPAASPGQWSVLAEKGEPGTDGAPGELQNSDIGVTIQGYDADLAAIAALTTTSFGRSFLALADAAAGRSHLGLAKTVAADVLAGTNDAKYLTPLSLAGATAISSSTGAGSWSPNFATQGTPRRVATGASTLAAPTNAIEGRTYVILLVQDATGSRAWSFATNYDFGIAGTPTASTGANKIDMVIATCLDATTQTFRAAFSKAS